jgi:hypothetical protein
MNMIDVLKLLVYVATVGLGNFLAYKRMNYHVISTLIKKVCDVNLLTPRHAPASTERTTLEKGTLFETDASLYN